MILGCLGMLLICSLYIVFRKSLLSNSQCVKSAYLSVLISKGINTSQRYDKTVNLNHIQIGEPVPAAINKLKNIMPEAFFYWHQIEKLLTQQ